VEIERRNYLKKIQKEIKSGKEIAQIYLIVYSFLIPQIFTTISASPYKIVYSAGLITLLCGFLLSFVNYFLTLTKTDDLMLFKRKQANRSAINLAFVFGYTFAYDVSLNLQLNPHAEISILGIKITDYAFGILITYYLLGSFISCIIAKSLLITTIPPINPLADELIRINNNLAAKHI
jgi:hypothetical protein